MAGVVELAQGLSLVPRARLVLEFARTDSRTLLKPVDEWHVKEWVRGQVKKGLKLEVGDKDLVHTKRKPAICWELLLWFVEADRVDKHLVPLLDAVELNVGGVRLRCSVKHQADDFCSWEAAAAGGTLRPDTLAIAGLPCRWFAEPRVSTRASPLVTHTIFSKFGRIKNLEIVEDPEEPLQCKIWIQFDQHSSCRQATQALCGRSMQKEGSSLKATYTVEWDTGDYFNVNNIRKRRFERERAEKLANDERLMQAQRARSAEQARQAQLEQVARARREEEEKRLKEEEERRRREEEERQLAEELRRREEEEALKRAQEEEEARRAEMHRQLVERKNQEIREATRRLLEEQARRKQEEEERKRQQAQDESRKREEEESAAAERWQLYLREGEPWSPSSCQVQMVAASGCTKRRLRSVVVGALQTNTRA